MSQRTTPLHSGGLVLAVALFAALAGCGERTQELRSKQPDQAPYAGGDKATWEAQIKARNQNQNEYVRAPARP
jgi:type IV pilus biogenesis protein CpaD/CtpE